LATRLLECYLPAHPHAVALIEEFLDAAGYRADQKKSTWKNDDRLPVASR
jgi:hypothetical protein